MTIYGLTEERITEIADRLELTVENMRRSGRGVALKLTPTSSNHRYARTSGSGRRLKACSFEAFRDFGLSCFANGATRLKTTQGDWHNVSEFNSALPALAKINLGSVATPAYMIDLSNEQVDRTIIKL